jgi:type IV pilus assembly protein PilA
MSFSDAQGMTKAAGTAVRSKMKIAAAMTYGCLEGNSVRHSKCNNQAGRLWKRQLFAVLGDNVMTKDKGFSLIELLIVVAIILVIAAIAVPSFLRSRIAANESSAASAVRMINSAQFSYSSAYPSTGFAGTLTALGGTACSPPDSTGACLIDTVLAAGQKSGYAFTLSGVSGTPSSSYSLVAAPTMANYSGVRTFCSVEDAVIRFSMTTIAACDSTVSPQP